jgi:hypothetical protein
MLNRMKKILGFLWRWFLLYDYFVLCMNSLQFHDCVYRVVTWIDLISL